MFSQRPHNLGWEPAGERSSSKTALASWPDSSGRLLPRPPCRELGDSLKRVNRAVSPPTRRMDRRASRIDENGCSQPSGLGEGGAHLSPYPRRRVA